MGSQAAGNGVGCGRAVLDDRLHSRLCWPLLVLVTGCGDSILLGDYLFWHANHETGDPNEWAEPGVEGSSVVNASVTDERAHRGNYSLELTNAGTESSIGVGFDFNVVREAYFSAWFYLPEAYTDIESWLLFGFASRGSGCTDADELCAGVDLRLRSVPNGDLVLYVFNSEPDALQPPLSDPPYFVPIARWFHVEARYRRAVDHSGRFHVWVDGEPLFRFEGWRTAEFDNLFWSVGSPPTEPALIYVDDAAISEIGVTPEGSLD